MTDSADHAINLYRWQALLMIQDHVPEAIEHLRTEVLPKYADILMKVLGMQPGPGEFVLVSGPTPQCPDRADLERAAQEAFQGWADKYGMKEQWMKYQGLRSLKAWYNYGLTDGWPEIGWDPHEVAHPKIHGWLGVPGTRDAYVQKMTGLIREYCDSVERAVQGREDAKAKHVKAHSMRKGVSTKAMPDRDPFRHIRWFVMKQVGDLSFGEIARKEGVSPQAVSDAHRKTATLLGIREENMRPLKRGRPKKVK